MDVAGIRRGRARDQLVGAQNLGLVIVAIAFVGFTIFVVSDLANGTQSMANRVSTAAAFGAFCGFVVAAASARTFVRDDTVHVVSFFVTYLIPVSEIVGVDAQNGMTIRVTSGRSIGSMAFGRSLIAMLTGNRRGKRAERRLVAIVGPFVGSLDSWKQDSVRAQPRWQALTLGLVIAGIAIAIAAA